MPDVMEISGRDRRRIRKMVDAFCARRDERERMRRAINLLYYFHEQEKISATFV